MAARTDFAVNDRRSCSFEVRRHKFRNFENNFHLRDFRSEIFESDPPPALVLNMHGEPERRLARRFPRTATHVCVLSFLSFLRNIVVTSFAGGDIINIQRQHPSESINHAARSAVCRRIILRYLKISRRTCH